MTWTIDKESDMEFMLHNIDMYFRREFDFENINHTILADKLILEFDKSLDFNTIMGVLNGCIKEFDEAIKVLEFKYNLKCSFELLLHSNVIKFKYL